MIAIHQNPKDRLKRGNMTALTLRRFILETLLFRWRLSGTSNGGSGQIYLGSYPMPHCLPAKVNAARGNPTWGIAAHCYLFIFGD